MVFYKIKPQIVVDDFIKKAPENIRNKFESKINDLKWFSERANEAIKQFGIWWRLLGFSYLSLYVLYYFYWILDFRIWTININLALCGINQPTQRRAVFDVFFHFFLQFFERVGFRAEFDDEIGADGRELFASCFRNRIPLF